MESAFDESVTQPQQVIDARRPAALGQPHPLRTEAKYIVEIFQAGDDLSLNRLGLCGQQRQNAVRRAGRYQLQGTLLMQLEKLLR